MNVLYPNLPGIFSEKTDGNLRPPVQGIRHTVGIFGTTSKGPGYYPVLVGDYTNLAAGLGTEGTALDGYYEALLGQPENVVITRIGATQCRVFLGTATEIVTMEYGADAAENYGVFVDKTNKLLKVYLLSGAEPELIWSNDPADEDEVAGKSLVDVTLDEGLFTEISGDIGSASAPVSFKTMFETPSADYFCVPGVNGTESSLSAMDLYEGMLQGFLAAESVDLDQIFVPGAFLDHPSMADDIKELNVDVTFPGITASGGEVCEVRIDDEVYTYTAAASDTQDEIGNAIAALVNASDIVDATYDATTDTLHILGENGGKPYTVTAKYDGTDLTQTTVQSFSDNKYVGKKTNVAVAAVDGSASSRFMVITDKYLLPSTVVVKEASVEVDAATYTLVKSGPNLYLIFDAAKTVADITIDYYRAENNSLPFIKWVQSEGQIHVTWSPFPTDEFSEANFAWEIARFAYELSANDNECLGVVAVTPPKSATPRDLAKWVGTEPAYDVNGNLTTPGTGLLGNKFMVGNLLGGPGFYATASRHINGIPLVDSNGHKVDLGRFIAVVVGWGLISSGNPKKAARYMGTPEGIFAAFDEMLPPNESATNKTLPGIKIPYRLTKKQLDALTKWNYTVVANESITGRSYVVDSPTAAAADSDYQQRQTMKIIRALLNDIREICRPFIGGPYSPRIIESQKSLLRERFAQRQNQGWIEFIDFQIKASVWDRILNREYLFMKVRPVSALRQLFVYSSLTAQE